MAFSTAEETAIKLHCGVDDSNPSSEPEGGNTHAVTFSEAGITTTDDLPEGNINLYSTSAESIKRTETDASEYGFVVDEDDMASDSVTKLPTQQSVKAYIDTEIDNKETLITIDALVASVNAVAICYGKVAWDDDPTWIEKVGGGLWPAESVSYVVGDSVYIRDATDVDIPVFKTYTYTGYTITSIKMINAILVVGTTAGLFVENIVTGEQEFYDSTTDIDLVDSAVNAVALTLLPNAPINPATGMRHVMITCATAGGVSIIDGPAGVGTVVDITGFTQFNLDYIYADKNRIICTGNYNGHVNIYEPIPSTDILANAKTRTYTESSVPAVFSVIPSQKELKYHNSIIHLAHTKGLSILHENPSDPLKGAVAYITKDYNTGLMRGDIQLATLVDTETGNIGGEEVTNGGFTTDDDWSLGDDWTISEGTANKAIGTAPYPVIEQITVFTTEKLYRVQFTISNYSGSGSFGLSSSCGTRYGVYEIAANGTVDCFVLAALTSIRIYGVSTVGGSVDNVSITEAIPDRCVQGNHVQVVGTLTKTPVATSAELVGFSGFSASNYGIIPYTSDFDFGTGDFYIKAWIDVVNGGSQFIYDRYDGTTFNNRVSLLINTTENLYFRIGAEAITSDNALSIGKHQIIAFRLSGYLYIFVDGESAASAVASTNSTTNSSNIVFIGNDYSGVGSFDSWIAVSHISATTPSVEQIKVDYLAELPMFQENTKITLSGSSNSVLALDYDKTTENITALTDVVDVFNGLVNIEQRALIGTGQCVSVGDGATLIGTSSQVTFIKPEINLREELAKVPVRLKQFGFVPVQLRFTGDTVETDFDLEPGYTPWAVYNVNGALILEGASDDYTVKDNGIYKTVSLAAAPSANNFVIFVILEEDYNVG